VGLHEVGGGGECVGEVVSFSDSRCAASEWGERDRDAQAETGGVRRFRCVVVSARRECSEEGEGFRRA